MLMMASALTTVAARDDEEEEEEDEEGLAEADAVAVLLSPPAMVPSAGSDDFFRHGQGASQHKQAVAQDAGQGGWPAGKMEGAPRQGKRLALGR